MDELKELFAKSRFTDEMMLKQGFVREEMFYILNGSLPEGFSYRFRVLNHRYLDCTVWDDEGQEYRLLFNKEAQGPFVGRLKSAFYAQMEQIHENTVPSFLSSSQGNMLLEKARQTYGDEPDMPFQDSEAVSLRVNGKWYALFMRVPRHKLVGQETGLVDVLNVKADDLSSVLLNEKGIYPAYHMNKKNWISIIMDEGMDDERLWRILQHSRQCVKPKKKEGRYYILPLHESRLNEFISSPKLPDHHGLPLKKGDRVLLYVYPKVNAVLYKCRVDAVLSIEQVYPQELFPRLILKEYGIRNPLKPHALSFKAARLFKEN